MRFWAILAVMALLVMLLMWQYPYMAGNTDRNMNILYMVLIIALIGSGGAFSRITFTQGLRNAAIWLGLILLIALAYSYRSDLQGSRLYGVLFPSRIQLTADGSLRVSRADDGHFHIIAEINGAPESFLVDTGASDISLSIRAAEAAGINTQSLNYSRTYQTANGTTSGAPVKLDTLTVGPVTLRDIPASVNKGELNESLLGMSFLNQFSSFQVQDNTLTLTP